MVVVVGGIEVPVVADVSVDDGVLVGADVAVENGVDVGVGVPVYKVDVVVVGNDGS
jgi:hypothetical protein